MPSFETDKHLQLKRLAAAWARASGYPIVSAEVRVPRSGYRADLAACSRGPARRTAVFECKQARADLLRDAHAEMATRRKLQELEARRRALEELLAVHRPDLRRGEALFPEFDAWDFTALEHRTHRRVIAELTAAQEHLRHGTKFARMFRYRCADYLQDGIFAEDEIPVGWGLLRRRGETLECARPPVALGPTPEQRLALLESIAMAASRTAAAAG